LAIAEVSPQPIAFPRRARRESSRLSRARLGGAWLPLASVLIGISSLFYLAQTSDLAATGYSIQELQAEESDLKLKNEQLALEVAKAKSLTAVEAEATGRLLMVPAKNPVYLQAPPVDNGSARAESTSRGEARAPALEKASAPPSPGLLDVLKDTMASALAPRSLRKP